MIWVGLLIVIYIPLFPIGHIFMNIHIQTFPVLLLQFDKNMLIKKHCMEHITSATQWQRNIYLHTYIHMNSIMLKDTVCLFETNRIQ